VRLNQPISRVIVREIRIRLVSRRFVKSECGVGGNGRMAVVEWMMNGELLSPSSTVEDMIVSEALTSSMEVCDASSLKVL